MCSNGNLSPIRSSHFWWDGLNIHPALNPERVSMKSIKSQNKTDFVEKVDEEISPENQVLNEFLHALS